MSEQTETGFTLSWDKATYKTDTINYSITGAGLKDLNVGKVLTYKFSELEKGTKYPVTIIAKDMTNDKIGSAQVSYTAETKGVPVPAKLEWETKPVVSNITSSTATVTWKAVSDSEDAITCQYSAKDSSGKEIASGTGVAAALTDLNSASDYIVNVTAKQDDQTIEASVSFKTKSSSGSGDWSADKVYKSGDQVTYNDHTYKAKWWTKGDQPDKGGPWERTDVEPGGEWSASMIYNTGDKVTYKDEEYQAKWWTKGDQPDKGGPWKAANVQPGGEWNATQVYNGGDEVTYNGQKYKAKWWTQGNQPDKGDPWVLVNNNI